MTDRELPKKLSQEDLDAVRDHLSETGSLVGLNVLEYTWVSKLPRWKRAVNWLSIRVIRRELFQTGAKPVDSEVLRKMLDGDHSFTFGYSDMPNKGERNHARPWDGEELF